MKQPIIYALLFIAGFVVAFGIFTPGRYRPTPIVPHVLDTWTGAVYDHGGERLSDYYKNTVANKVVTKDQALALLPPGYVLDTPCHSQSNHKVSPESFDPDAYLAQPSGFVPPEVLEEIKKQKARDDDNPYLIKSKFGGIPIDDK